MQSLANIGGLLLLMMYIYSIIGMIYFGEVKRNSTMSDYINFESFTSAFITLFTVATVDSWNYTMISFSYVLSPANECVE
jgi:cytochrome c biogenesis protein ResB